MFRINKEKKTNLAHFRAQTTHPWEKNSPVYENRDYMQHCYWDLLKKEYLKEASVHSQVYLLEFSIFERGDSHTCRGDVRCVVRVGRDCCGSGMFFFHPGSRIQGQIGSGSLSPSTRGHGENN